MLCCVVGEREENKTGEEFTAQVWAKNEKQGFIRDVHDVGEQCKEPARNENKVLPGTLQNLQLKRGCRMAQLDRLGEGVRVAGKAVGAGGNGAGQGWGE